MSDVIFWFRRDLRLKDNAGLYHALKQGSGVRPIFIFDTDILDQLKDEHDFRLPFLHQTISELAQEITSEGGHLEVYHGKVKDVFKEIFKSGSIQALYTNHDYEPSAIDRDNEIKKLAEKQGLPFLTFKDQVIFEKSEILSLSQKPYTVYTPYKKKWLASLDHFYLKSYPVEKYLKNLKPLKKEKTQVPTLKQLGFARSLQSYPPAHVTNGLLKHYARDRDFPTIAGGTSRLGLHLRFGTLSVRQLVRQAKASSAVWLSELIWREFFMQILFHFPHVEKSSFRPQYDKVEWRENKAEFKKWCLGQTGYPFVDAGMRELNQTGFMHNRVRMITASFLTKHLLMYWYQGERYFAAKLLDYELSANNGNWQWAAGTGCDAAPYFRVFNPETQMKKFDPDLEYVKKWVPEYGTSQYPPPMVDHVQARERALRAFGKALKGNAT